MSYTQHVHSEERDRAKGLLRLHTTDESILLLLRRHCLSVASVDTRDGTVPQATAASSCIRCIGSQLQPGMKVYFYKPPSQQEVTTKGRKVKHLAHYHGPATVTANPRRRQLELQYEGKKTFNRDISLVIPVKDFGSLDEDSFDPVTTETVATPSLHIKGEIPKEGELVVIKDSSTKGWFLSEVLRVLPNLVEVRYFTTPTPPLDNYERCSVHKRSKRLSEICFRRTWHVRFGKHVGRATYKPPYPNNEDLQVWKVVLNTSDLDEVLLIRNVKIDAEGKLDEASLRLAAHAQLSISHEKLDTIEDEIDMTSLTPNLFLSSRENLCSCIACSRLLSRDYIVAQDSNGASDSHFPVD
jgi:hypothetical protein